MATSILITIPAITPITTPLVESFVVDEPDAVDITDIDETTERKDGVEKDVDGVDVAGVDNEMDVNGKNDDGLTDVRGMDMTGMEIKEIDIMSVEWMLKK